MIVDFSFEQAMRLHTVKRWGIIETSREQSVAEHSYNVAVITAGLIDEMNRIAGDRGQVIFPPGMGKGIIKLEALQWALSHDLPELISGDLPTPVKEHVGDALEKFETEMFPKYTEVKQGLNPIVRAVTKCADWMDAIQFATKYCTDTRKSEIISEMYQKLAAFASFSQMEHKLPLPEAIESLWLSWKTPSKNT